MSWSSCCFSWRRQVARGHWRMCWERFREAEPNNLLLGGLVWIAFLKLTQEINSFNSHIITSFSSHFPFLFVFDYFLLLWIFMFFIFFFVDVKVGGLYHSIALFFAFWNYYYFFVLYLFYKYMLVVGCTNEDAAGIKN